MASVRQIAKRVGVSVATVSRALNNSPHVNPETREKVLAAANRSGYSPSVGKRLRTVIGLLYPGEPVKADYGAFESALLAGMLRGVNEQKFDVTLVSLQRDRLPTESYTQFFMRKGLRGVIVRVFENSRRVAEEIAGEGFPSVVVADRFDDPRVNFVCCDSREDSRRAVEHLVHLGHRRIALYTHNVPDTDHRDRRAGYMEALAAHNIAVDPSLLVEMVASPDGGASAITRLMSLPNPPTAIYFADPLATIGAMHRCHALGIQIPSELSIVGFDDSDIRQHTWPPFTSVVQDANMLGYEAALWLTRNVTGNAAGSLRLRRPTMFEINRSTAPPPKRPVRISPDGSRMSVEDGTGL
jgi:DNA-binding LacI/PurR family transcriptional regulator